MKKEFLSEEIYFTQKYLVAMLEMIDEMIQQLGKQIRQETTATAESIKRIEPEEKENDKD